ncbi:MAG: TOBE domain-containing protein, partial [Candidatus Heimdallarchaeota archaeon]|nr:TOBE domain-containing protein [Candidatus Heimdallarchaeota archaeon]
VSKDEYVLAIKADSITVAPVTETREDGPNEFIGKIKDMYFLGKWVHLVITIESFPKQIVIAIPSTEMKDYELENDVTIKLDIEDIIHYNEPWDKIKHLEDT